MKWPTQDLEPLLILGNERVDQFAKATINPKAILPRALPESYDPNDEEFQEEFLNNGLFLLSDNPESPAFIVPLLRFTTTAEMHLHQTFI